MRGMRKSSGQKSCSGLRRQPRRDRACFCYAAFCGFRRIRKWRIPRVPACGDRTGADRLRPSPSRGEGRCRRSARPQCSRLRGTRCPAPLGRRARSTGVGETNAPVYLTLSADEIHETWDSEVRAISRSGFARPPKRPCRREHGDGDVPLQASRENDAFPVAVFNADGAKQNHPFSLATIGALWTREGTPPLADQFSLVLAFARDPSVPPCLRLPGAEAMAT